MTAASMTAASTRSCPCRRTARASGRAASNQAELLARGVAERINATVSDTLEVVRSARDQVELSAAQRRANVAGAYGARSIARSRVPPIDGVFTPGATMSACAETLVRAGARRPAPEPMQDMLEQVSTSALKILLVPPAVSEMTCRSWSMWRPIFSRCGDADTMAKGG